jgi:hypothetical protein
MLQLPALDPEERACLQALQTGGVLHELAERLRQRLVAALGVAVSVCGIPDKPAQRLPGDPEPVIMIAPELTAAWLSVRFGGKPEASGLPFREAALAAPFQALVRRALAETVINLGEAVWPQAMRYSVNLGPQQGVVEIFWNSERAAQWAHRVLRERA